MKLDRSTTAINAKRQANVSKCIAQREKRKSPLFPPLFFSPLHPPYYLTPYNPPKEKRESDILRARATR
uniref:Uncharacterized protein n=1 Tax=Siphoviridae sp. ctfhy6 TaxID=2825597 RepID=A0A8S5VAU8_9CAUD|nr:MAG TPA: hypothetical protein [Siphoviridae sp. ctfhy6]